MIGKILVMGAILGCCIGSSAMAGPLAPSADVDGKMAMFVKTQERQVPDSSEVGIPAYPGSSFCTIKRGKWGPGAWSEVHLLSADSYEKVAAWYRENLDGWHCKEWAPGLKTSCSDKNPGEAGNYDPETFNKVDILKTEKTLPCILPGLKTAITLMVQPD